METYKVAVTVIVTVQASDLDDAQWQAVQAASEIGSVQETLAY